MLVEKEETKELFEKLARPQIKKAVKNNTQADEVAGYKETERNDLDRLIESVE